MIKTYFSTNQDLDLRELQTKKNLCSKLQIDFQNLKYMRQVHSNDVQIVILEQTTYECDALITDQNDIALLVLVADCIPILFYDEKEGVIAVAHAGRNGTFLKIAQKTIEKMISVFKCDPQNIKIELGPSIQKCCYEVDSSMCEIVVKNFGKKFVVDNNIDLQGINKQQILDLGIKKDNISISEICTKCNGKDYYSYRNDPNCGRFGAIITKK